MERLCVPCWAGKGREKLHRAPALEPGWQGRSLYPQDPTADTGRLVLNSLNRRTRFLFSRSAARHLLEICHVSSVAGGRLLGATHSWLRRLFSNHLPSSAPAFKPRPSIWLFIQSSAPKQATGSSLQINEALPLPGEGYIKYQSCVLFYNIITLAINP